MIYFRLPIADCRFVSNSRLLIRQSAIGNRQSLLVSLVNHDAKMARALHDRVRLAAVLWLEALDRRAGVGPGFRDVQRVAPGLCVLLAGVGDGGADDLFDHAAGALLTEAQDRQRV